VEFGTEGPRLSPPPPPPYNSRGDTGALNRRAEEGGRRTTYRITGCGFFPAFGRAEIPFVAKGKNKHAGTISKGGRRSPNEKTGAKGTSPKVLMCVCEDGIMRRGPGFLRRDRTSSRRFRTKGCEEKKNRRTRSQRRKRMREGTERPAIIAM